METCRNISNTFGPGMAKVQCYGGSSFAKETRALKMRSAVTGPRKFQWPIERIIKAHPLTTTREIAEERNVDHPMVFWHLEQIGKVKQLDKWAPHMLTKNQTFWSVAFSYCTQAPFLDWIVMCDEKWILYDNQWQPAQCFDWKEAPKHFPKPNLHRKKVMVTVWWSAACLIHYNFLNPNETITSEKYAQQIDEMYWNLQWLQPALVNRKGPTLLHDNTLPHVTQPMLQKFKKKKVERIGLRSFASSSIFTWPL